MKLPSFIGGVKAQENIVEKWRSYYHQIFNSTPNSIDNRNYDNVESMKGIEFIVSDVLYYRSRIWT